MTDDPKTTWLGYYLYPAQWIESSPVNLEEDGNQLIFNGTKAVEAVWSGKIRTRTYDFDVIAYRDGLFEFYFKYILKHEKRVPFSADLTQIRDLDDEISSNIVRLFNAQLACLFVSLRRNLDDTEFRKLRFGTYAVMKPQMWGFTRNETGGGQGFRGNLPDYLTITRALVAHHPSVILGGDIDNIIWGLSGYISRGGLLSAIPVKAIQDSFDLLTSLLNQQRAVNLITVWALLAKSLQSFVDADYDWCLINAWVAIERIISDVWSDYLQNNRQRQTITGTLQQFINKKRLDELERYDASKKIEILSLLGVLDHRIYESLTGIRRKRNDWVHSLKRVEVEDANQAIDLLMVLLEGIYAPKNLA